MERIRIVPDEVPINPRKEFDNLATIVAWHSRYSLGDEEPESVEVICPRCDGTGIEPGTDEEESCEMCYGEEVIEGNGPSIWSLWLQEKKAYYKPIRIYDHSGITISTSSGYPYNDQWDAGFLGFIYILPEKMEEEFANLNPKEELDQAYKRIEAEIQEYDSFLSGDIWGFVHEKLCSDCEQWEEIDSCWGFYGSDPKENGMNEYFPGNWEEILEETI